MTFFTFPKELTEKLKERNAVSPQPVEQNLLHIEKNFKDTVDRRKCSRDSFGCRYSQT